MTTTTMTTMTTTVLLSVGSGSGLLERFLHDELPREDGGSVREGRGGDVRVFGVEVPSSPTVDGRRGGEAVGLNGYLPEEQRVEVKGTWDLVRPEGVLALLEGWGGEWDGGGDDEGDVSTIDQEGELLDDTTKTPENVGVILMFIYPRQPSLMRKYIQIYQTSSEAHTHDHRLSSETTSQPIHSHTSPPSPSINLQGIIWAGPRADWEDDYAAVFAELQQHLNGVDHAAIEEGSGWEVTTRWGVEVGVADGEGVVVAMRR